MIDTIVFDFGGVLIDWNPKYVYEKVFDNADEMDWFLNNICTNEWNLEQDKGRPFADGVALLHEKFPEYNKQISMFQSHWKNMLKGEISETVELLKKLKKRYKIYGLTNWSAETFPVALERFEFLKLFDDIIVSGVEKMIKPDKKFFNLLLDRFNLKAENCVFIDDNEKNIQAASQLGFQAIQFISTELLKKELKLLQAIN